MNRLVPKDVKMAQITKTLITETVFPGLLSPRVSSKFEGKVQNLLYTHEVGTYMDEKAGNIRHAQLSVNKYQSIVSHQVEIIENDKDYNMADS